MSFPLPPVLMSMFVFAVRDFSAASVSVQPAEFASWGDARSELMIERTPSCANSNSPTQPPCPPSEVRSFVSTVKRPLKAQLSAELSAAASDETRSEITAAFASREKALEHELDHKPLDVHLTLDVSYNFLSR